MKTISKKYRALTRFTVTLYSAVNSNRGSQTVNPVKKYRLLPRWRIPWFTAVFSRISVQKGNGSPFLLVCCQSAVHYYDFIAVFNCGWWRTQRAIDKPLINFLLVLKPRFEQVTFILLVWEFPAEPNFTFELVLNIVLVMNINITWRKLAWPFSHMPTYQIVRTHMLFMGSSRRILLIDKLETIDSSSCSRWWGCRRWSFDNRYTCFM